MSDLVMAAEGEKPELGEADEHRAIVFSLDGTPFALPIDVVDEVVRVPPITPVPFPPDDVIGVVGIRGMILPVLDLGCRILGIPALKTGRLILITVPSTGEEVALAVDEVTQLIPLSQAVEEIPDEVSQSLHPGWILSMLNSSEDRLVTLLDIDAVLATDHSRENDK